MNPPVERIMEHPGACAVVPLQRQLRPLLSPSRRLAVLHSFPLPIRRLEGALSCPPPVSRGDQEGFTPGASLILALSLFGCGCAGDARVALTAADSMDALSAAFSSAVEEYHADLEKLDDGREAAALDAFIARIRADATDDEKSAAHAAAFRDAMQRLRADRRVAESRKNASLENLETLREIAAGLRRLAVDSLNLDDDVQRYFGELLESHRVRNLSEPGAQATDGH